MSDAETSRNINFKSLIVFKMIFDIHVSYLYQHINILKRNSPKIKHKGFALGQNRLVINF